MRRRRRATRNALRNPVRGESDEDVKPGAPRLRARATLRVDHAALDAWDAILPRAPGAGPLAPVASHPSQRSKWQPLRTPPSEDATRKIRSSETARGPGPPPSSQPNDSSRDVVARNSSPFVCAAKPLCRPTAGAGRNVARRSLGALRLIAARASLFLSCQGWHCRAYGTQISWAARLGSRLD